MIELATKLDSSDSFLSGEEEEDRNSLAISLGAEAGTDPQRVGCAYS